MFYPNAEHIVLMHSQDYKLACFVEIFLLINICELSQKVKSWNSFIMQNVKISGENLIIDVITVVS